MELRCPACRSKIALEDVNPSTDVALCRHCGRTYSFAALSGPAIDLTAAPSGTRFENLPGGFMVEATTRSWMAVFLIPFTCVWAGGALGGIYVRPMLHGQFNPYESLVGLPFLLGSIGLVGMCSMLTGGVVRVTRQGDDLEIFTGAGPVGWRRRYRWSEIRTVREDVGGSGRGQRRFIFLEGARRAAFGSLLSEERRYFMLQTLRKMLASG